VGEEVLFQGAEAVLVKTVWKNRLVVEKRRASKKYRLEEIDSMLISQRTRDEARLIASARAAGVCVPVVYDVDMRRGVLVLEFVEGIRVKEYLGSLESEGQRKLCSSIGSCVALLHNGGVVHGDLTTSNMIFSKAERIVFIDFGLGAKSEDVESFGVDLHVLMEAFESTHSEFEQCFEWVLEGYERCFAGDAEVVRKKIEQIVRRGRYR